MDDTPDPTQTFAKPADERVAACEQAGLEWLRVPGGARVVEVVERRGGTLLLERILTAGPERHFAEEFGRGLAVTHDAGAPAFGIGPPGWSGDGYQGPADQLLDLPLAPFDSWGAMFAELRLEPLLGRSGIDRHGFEPVLRRLRDGEFDDDDPPARLHGDLWTGNLLWSADGCVLIDPTAYAGHRETDLAELALFGCPELDRILAGYQEQHPLADGWRQRIGLHQLHMVLLHVVLFGGGYVDQAESLARRYR